MKLLGGQSINWDGIQRTSEGSKMIKAKTRTLASRKREVLRKIVPMRSPDTAEQTFRQLPTGGVQAPTAKPETRTTPNKIET